MNYFFTSYSQPKHPTFHKKYLYIAQTNDWTNLEVVKVGVTNNPKNRLISLKNANPNEVKYLKVFDLLGKNAYCLEQIIAEDFKHLNYYNNGGTEFYQQSIVDEIDALMDIVDHTSLSHDEAIDIDIENDVDDTDITLNDTLKQEIMDFRTEFGLVNEDELEKQNIKLFDYQIDTVNKATTELLSNKRCIINWTCGLGKTITALSIVDNMKLKTVCIYVPTNILKVQWRDNILKMFGDESNVLMYPEESLAKITGKSFIITTYSSSNKLNLEAEKYGIEFDMIIYDECHHLTTTNKDDLNDNKDSYNKAFNTKGKYSLGLTATMKTYDEGNDKIISNNCEQYFGSVVDEKTLLWAIEKKKVCDYNIYTLIANKYDIINIINQINSNMSVQEQNLFVSAYIGLKCLENGICHHIVNYCNSHNSTNKFEEYLNYLIDNGYFDSIKNDLYHSGLTKTNKVIVNYHIDKFTRSKLGILTNCYIIGEGWDCPMVDACLISEKMGSNIRITQSMTRCLRLNPNDNSKTGKIIIPVLNVNEDNWLDDNNSYNYKKIKNIFVKLGIEDENIDQKMIFKKTNVRDRKSNSYNTNEIDDLSDDVDGVLTGKIRKINRNIFGYYSYNKAKQVLKNRNILNLSDYVDLTHKLPRLHLKPHIYYSENYRNEWNGWFDYLNINKDNYLNEQDLTNKLSELNVTSFKDYKANFEKYQLVEPKLPLPSFFDEGFSKNFNDCMAVKKEYKYI